MKNIRKFALSVTLIGNLLINGCASYGPGSKSFESQVGRLEYTEVNSFRYSMDEACAVKDNANADFCSDRKNYVWIGGLIGQHGVGLLYKTAFAVPLSEHVSKGDIIAFRFGDDDHPWGYFDHVAKRATDGPSKNCSWEGSHFSTGGVVCEGWRYDRDFPPLAE